MNEADESQITMDPSSNGHDSSQNPAEASGQKLESIRRNEAGQLVVCLKDGEPIVDARIARCFPWSMPDTYISIRNREGKEVVLLKTLDGVNADSREIILRELHDKVFNPQIQHIIEHKNEFGVTSIKARTDRGEVTFQVRSRDDIRILSATRLLFRDADGNTYEIADAAAMDAASQKFLETYF